MANNIVDEIGRYSELRRTGDRLMGLCPFPDHNEKTGSFSVREDMQVYYCFGCKKTGTIFRFMQEMQGLSFPETVQTLAQRAGIEMPKDEANEIYRSDKNAQKTAQLKRVNQLAAEYFKNQLWQLKPDDYRHRYIVQRSITPDIMKKFGLGIAHDGWDGLLQEFQNKKVPLNLAEELGLLKKKKQQGSYDAFRNRFMFPIFSQTGECIGFGGRTLGEDKAKYLNSPESLLFHKGKVLYGLHETAKYIRSEDQAIIVEGYMDCLALYRAGIKNVVAVLGTALTEDHAKLLSRFTKNLVVLFDGDKSGQDAAERSLPILLNAKLMPKTVFLPNQQDPDDFIKNEGAEALREVIKSAPDLFSHILKLELSNFKGQATDKVKLVDKMSVYLTCIEDQRLLNLYVEELAASIGQRVQWVYDASKIKRPGNPQKFTRSMARDVKPVRGGSWLTKAPKAEWYLLNLALSDRKLFEELDSSEAIKQFLSQEIQQIFARANMVYRQNPNDFDKLTALLATEVDPPIAVTKHLDKTWSNLTGESSRKLFSDCLKRVKEAYLRKEQKHLAEKMRGSNIEERKEQLEQFMNIQKSRQALHKESDKN